MTSIYDSQWRTAYVQAHPYEQERWFSDEEVRAEFFMIRDFLTHFLARIKKHVPPNVIDVGFGVGTWSEVFANAWRTTSFDLVGRIEPQHEFAKMRFQAYSHVHYVPTDFLEYPPGKVYEFFFSTTLLNESHRIAKNLQHMNLMLSWGGEGLLMADVPGSVSTWMSRHRVIEDMKASCTRAGMHVLHVYPVVVTVPWFHSGIVSVFFSYLVHRFQYHFFLAPFIKTYAVYCKKM